MEKVNKLMRELELEINKLESEYGNNLIIKSGGETLECEYEYLSMDSLTSDELMCLALSDDYNETGISISLTLKDALNLQEHIGKLIKNYLLHNLELREEV